MLEIKKRNGIVVPFDANKITIAMEKAFIASSATYSNDVLSDLTRKVVSDIEEKFLDQTPSVENVQDFVELALMYGGHLEVAKHYIVYRYEHAKIREEKKQEFLEKVELEGFMVTTGDGTTERYDEAKVRSTLERAAAGFTDADLDTVMSQVKFELYDNISTEDLSRALIMVVRSMIERDPCYSKIAARLLLSSIYEEALGREARDPEKVNELHLAGFRTAMERGVKIGRIAPELLTFDLESLARTLDM